MECLRERGKNEAKLNVTKITRTYLLCMKDDVSSVGEKVTRNDTNYLRSFTLQL